MAHERVQILLDPKQRAALARRARQTGRSISDLVREYVEKGLESKENKQETLDRIQAHRKKMLEQRGGKPLPVNPADVIAEIREERSSELCGN